VVAVEHQRDPVGDLEARLPPGEPYRVEVVVPLEHGATACKPSRSTWVPIERLHRQQQSSAPS
jgi:hypothetical protein